MGEAEPRKVFFLQGVIVAASTVFIGDIPNYGTGGNYWRSSPPVPAEHTLLFTMQPCFNMKRNHLPRQDKRN
jgi:hypothetical protein